jgi:predicted N-acyltransferase
VERFSSIHEVPEALWDGLVGDKQPFHRHRFLRAVEDARVENARFWYLVFFADGRLERPVATAVLSAFTVSLDLFLGRAVQRLVERLRMRFPPLLRLDVLFCGLPVSLGQGNLAVADPAATEAVLWLLTLQMEAIAEAHGLRYLCVKEFRHRELGAVAGLERCGFFRGHSLPAMAMAIRWRSFDEYLASLRHDYRRRIKKARAKLAGTRWALGGTEVISPARFHALYRNVMARAATRLELLDQAFFERLWAELRAELQILAIERDREILGAALLLKTGATLRFVLVGLPAEARTEQDVYLNLLSAIVEQAIRQECRTLVLGQTAYWSKQSIGGVAEPEYLFFKARDRRLHAVLRLLRGVLFPRLKLKAVRVFHQ